MTPPEPGMKKQRGIPEGGTVSFGKRFHRQFGRHSGIPSCCIRAWVAGEPYSDVPWGCRYRPCRKCTLRILRGVHKPAVIIVCDDMAQSGPYWRRHHCGKTPDDFGRQRQHAPLGDTLSGSPPVDVS